MNHQFLKLKRFVHSINTLGLFGDIVQPVGQLETSGLVIRNSMHVSIYSTSIESMSDNYAYK